jgi:hypothetical protein
MHIFWLSSKMHPTSSHGVSSNAPAVALALQYESSHNVIGGIVVRFVDVETEIAANTITASVATKLK